MNEYSKETFLSLNPVRQVKVSLDAIYALEKVWDDDLGRAPQLSKVINYLHWISSTDLDTDLRIHHLIHSIDKESSLRKVLNIATALERYLNISVKDETIVVHKKDKFIKNKETKPIYVVLDNLRSAFNVGSIFRTAECLGVRHIYLVGYTPTPNDKPVQKTAMGTDELVSWSSVNRISDVIQDLKSKSISMVALETTNQSVDLFTAKTKPGLALFLGNERFGLEADVLEGMDQILEIPMLGSKNSLNVSNAFAISAAELLRSWR